ncbi:MAG: hypothetical protein DME17_19730 [Candidatus Rokuibacteriota bacterium]|nr:MAG: hypothetical protein DME17_19730 [Candidatus Rokubacteria bacterium]
MLTALVAGLALNGVAIAQETANQGELARTLETADLSPEAKALVRHKALEAVRLGLAEGEVAELVQRGVDRGFPARELTRLLEVVTEAKRHDLPVGPVLEKVKEGLAKRVPPERIVNAASRMSSELATARDLIRQAEREGVRVAKARQRERAIEAVAEALGQGVPPSEVAKLSRKVAGAAPRAGTMSLLDEGVEIAADLVSMGLSPQDATETVAEGISQGLGQRDLNEREPCPFSTRGSRSPPISSRWASPPRTPPRRSRRGYPRVWASATSSGSARALLASSSAELPRRREPSGSARSSGPDGTNIVFAGMMPEIAASLRSP